jgi:hypothetical protein
MGLLGYYVGLFTVFNCSYSSRMLARHVTGGILLFSYKCNFNWIFLGFVQVHCIIMFVVRKSVLVVSSSFIVTYTRRRLYYFVAV